MDTSNDVKGLLALATQAMERAAEQQVLGREGRVRYYKLRAGLFRRAAEALRICGTQPKETK